MTPFDIFLLVLPPFLVAGLLLCLHVRREFGRPGDESGWVGTGFNASAIVPRIRRVRASFVSEVRSLPARTCQRRAAVAKARLALVQRAHYFKAADPGEPQGDAHVLR